MSYIYTLEEIAELQKEIAVTNRKWWFDERGNPIQTSDLLKLMLVITEFSEAMEGIRKDLNDTHLPHRKMEEVEMADAFIRLIDFAYHKNLKISEGLYSILAEESKENNLFVLCYIVTQYEAGSFRSDLVINDAINVVQLYCEAYGLDLKGAVREKMEYNKTRKDHQKEARAEANGKKW